MKKVFVLKSKNEKTGEIKLLSTWAIKDYHYAVETLKEKMISARYELMKEEYNKDTDMTEILKGFIEVYETKKGQFYEINEIEPAKTYNYSF